MSRRWLGLDAARVQDDYVRVVKSCLYCDPDGIVLYPRGTLTTPELNMIVLAAELAIQVRIIHTIWDAPDDTVWLTQPLWMIQGEGPEWYWVEAVFGNQGSKARRHDA